MGYFHPVADIFFSSSNQLLREVLSSQIEEPRENACAFLSYHASDAVQVGVHGGWRALLFAPDRFQLLDAFVAPSRLLILRSVTASFFCNQDMFVKK